MLRLLESGSAIAPLVLLESVRARVSVATPSFFLTLFSILLFVPVFTSQGVSIMRMAAWIVPITLLSLARTFYSRRTLATLHQMHYSQVYRVDATLRLSSLCNQVTVGLGIWIIQSDTGSPYVLPLFMTLICVIFSIGVLANLFSDFRSFVMSIPLLMGQPAAYWMYQENFGLTIGVGMLLATTLMLMLVHRGSDVFRQSVLMRFEKDRLLAQVEDEKERTQQALQEAQAANDSKTFFMAAASHDIKQPLFALGMLTDTLLMSDIQEDVRGILDKQRSNITAMAEHFDALMDLGKFQGGGFEISYSNVRLVDLASRIDGEFSPLCADKGLTWRIDMVDAVIETDRELLLRLFRNLLSNALRFTSEGEIRCTATPIDDELEFAVTDSGPGIAPEDQEKIFGEFVRLETTGPDNTGAGLGLAIVNHIDSALGLNLKLESALGEGTRFSFRLPRANA